MKKIFFVISLFLLSGCTINYNLEIDENQIKENISGEVSKEETIIKEEDTGLNIYYVMLYNDQKALLDGDDLYKKDINEENNNIKYNYSYTYQNNYDKSRLINTCFKDPIIKETDDLYYIKLEGRFFCMYSDKVTINVTSNYAVVDNNAQKVEDNTYTWVIDDSNNVNIYLTVSKTIKNEKPSKTKFISTFQLIGLIVFVVLTGITYFLYRKKNSGKV
ncbi:MAG: hypothetical protein ACI310_02430 [Bacilli bacterium]